MNLWLLFLSLLLSRLVGASGDEVVVIGHSTLTKTDRITVQRLYTGRIVSIGTQAVAPVNLPAGNALRDEFLQMVMEQNEEQYSGYWLVRRYVGKGLPPKEVASVEEVVKHVVATPGAVGYVPASKLPAGANVIYKR